MADSKDVWNLIAQLLDDVSHDDIEYHLRVMREIKQGEADIEAGRTVSHDHKMKQLRAKYL